MGEQINQNTDELAFLCFKNYERCHYSQFFDYFDKNVFPKYQCGFRNQDEDALLVTIEKMKTAQDNKEFCTAILTDLSKVFDCICHDFLIATLNTYGFD